MSTTADDTAIWSVPTIVGTGAPRSVADRPGRFAGLDGLRAVAVLAVVVFHLDAGLSPAGFLGVDLFFVISGFLITNLLVTEILDTGRLDLLAFYRRRARRLLPGVIVLMAAVALGSATVWHDQLATLTGSVWSSLGYVTNWWLIGAHQSYFVSSGRPPMLQHLWSLAIEEQFYLVWSVVVVLIVGGVVTRRMTPLNRLRTLQAVALVAAVATTAAMVVRAVHTDLPYGGSTSRVYFGSDTHSMGLFLGAAAGTWIAASRERARTSAPRRSPAVPVWATDAITVLALAGLVRQFFALDEFSPGLYRGGFLAFAALAVVVVLGVVRRGSRVGSSLDVAPLRWLGRRSYSIYLWHWPVVVVTRPGLDVQGPTWLLNILRVALILGLASLSYRLVEVPLRHRDSGAVDRNRDPQAIADRHTRLLATGVLVVSASAALALAAPPADATPHVAPRPAPNAPVSDHAHGAGHGGRVMPPTPGSGRPVVPVRPGSPVAPAPGRHPVAVKPSVSAFGDSVLLGAQIPLRAGCRTLRLDAVEGRSSYDVLNDIAAAARAGRLQTDVLIHQGNNGIIDPAQLRSTLKAIGSSHRVVIATLRVPRDWQDPNNRTIRSVAKSFSYVRVVDWHSLSAGHPDWLYADGIHLRPAGATAYARIVLTAFAR